MYHDRKMVDVKKGKEVFGRQFQKKNNKKSKLKNFGFFLSGKRLKNCQIKHNLKKILINFH